MAAAGKTKRETSNLPVNYAEQLSKEAQDIGRRLQAGSGGAKIRANGNVNFRLPDGSEAPEIEGVVVDFMSINTWYDRPFDRDNPGAPACYAIGEIPSIMQPEKDSPVRQADSCTVCPLNQFGSADNGKGKACRNRRVLAILPEDADENADIMVLDIPPASIKNFDSYVAGLSTKQKTVPIGVVTRISLDKSQQYFSPRFDVVKPVDDSALGHLIPRREEARKILNQKPDVSKYEPPAKGRAARR